MLINGKTAVVTGGASGIGEAIARRFAEDGASHIVVIDRDADRAQAVAADIGGTSAVLDVADPDATHEVFKRIEATIAPIDVACLNAGVAIDGSFDAPDSEWTTAWDVNVMAHVFAARELVPGMIARGGGYIITTASAAGLLTNIGAAPYAVTKHAAVAFSEWLAVTYGRRGLAVSCLCPQFVDTPMLDVFGASSDTMRDWVTDLAIRPDDVADAVVEAMHEERFLVLPHPEVGDYFRHKATDYDRWIGGMQGLQSKMVPGT
ncbi:MAG: SDR family oxidoreductase [Acidimicrobiia bacterium]